MPAEVTAPPEPFAIGTYALYDTPGGGVHISIREKDGPEHHREVPPFLVEMVRKGELTPGTLLRALRRGRRAV